MVARRAKDDAGTRLSFHDKLVGKQQTTDALQRKLRTLSEELASASQDGFDPKSLDAVKKDLIHTSILLHKDRGVKAFAACCLADILRLTAPDAPYTQPELRDIFQFFFRQLVSGLKGHDQPYYTEYFALLNSLSTVKSVVLICDLPNADEVMADVFRDFFQLVRRDLQKKVEMNLAEILIALIDEAQSVPQEVLDLIMAQFMDKHTGLEHPAYRLAVQVCNNTADKLQRHVSQRFTEKMVAEPDGEDDDKYEDIRVELQLIKRLHHSCPALLPTVIPQLEQQLYTEDVQIRLIVTQVLGEMLADPVNGAELAAKHPGTWGAWLKRKSDRAPAVRVKFVDVARALLGSAHEAQRSAVEDALGDRLMDPDEKVRAAVCRLYGQLDYETALHHVGVEQLRKLAERTQDKKYTVRRAAFLTLGKLYSLAYPEIENHDSKALEQFAWIPSQLYQSARRNPETKPLLEEILAEYILPLPGVSTPAAKDKGSAKAKNDEIDEIAWTDRLLTVMAYLEADEVNSLLSLSGLQRKPPTVFEIFVDACIANNGGVIDENEELVKRRLTEIIRHIGSACLDPARAVEDLNAFAKLNEQRLYKLLRTCADPQTDLKGLVKATNEFTKRIDTLAASISPTTSFVLQQTSLRMANLSSIPTLLKRLQKSNVTTEDNAFTLLNFMSKHRPALFKSHVGELIKVISDEKVREKRPKLVEVALKALGEMVKTDETMVVLDKRAIERIQLLAIEGTFRQAKFAARFLAFAKKEALCNEVVETICTSLGDTTPEVLLAHVAVLAQLARHCVNAFEHKSDVLMKFLMKDLLQVPTHPLDEEMDVDEEWAEDSDISDNLRTKVLALKVLRNRCLAHVKADGKSVDGDMKDVAGPVIRMLAQLLENGGSMIADSGEDKKVMSRMRLQAAISLLHLSSAEVYGKLIASRFLRLALVVQDSCFEVRHTFVRKLVKFLSMNRAPIQFNVIPFMTVHDPEEDVRNVASGYIKSAMHKLRPDKRVQSIEMMFIRLLHLLAHHPDFGQEVDEMVDIAKYIRFYLAQVGNAETISLLYHLAGKAKTVRDNDPQYSKNLYIMSEFAQELIKIWAHQHGLNITTFPGKIKLPSDIFAPLSGPEESRKVMAKEYLPKEVLDWATEQYASAKEKKEKERKERAEGKAVERANKRKAPPKTTNGSAPKRKRRRNSGRDEDDESATEASDDEMEGAEKSEPAPVKEDEEEESEPDGEVKLGRGQRSKAKRKQARAARKTKQDSPSSEG
ncbi:hypothetical protein MKEN_00603700 [Mycena kentingensis (nom. inval.)]|nr:hypothetical protein MKEN_00603700 [Mycena kentingensis (nom. inval.)]